MFLYLQIGQSYYTYSDASKLTLEKGMFGTLKDQNGYTFWIDELKYEKLGTVAQPRPAIF
jgi:hypothetical protein